ncbi:hypothetical protein FRACYDRAFT_194029 [Fragilariopsis cylindrus CCMP1102]|uniref:Helicase-associated domain-containing protein n=1 Tax=Fragilariopsis cylindrus CCMP1102 TaxID=635003 RepID=A0A1E7EXX6_9STRA|nr:hypothetical protein FRACYDRAFT_194029 [Fragilariopsis cylindrus CCMP1102]|eukprot:OEU10393.1 hypothetical protein FRACYDRAFT_194029 [Fragilariopsis cylindrus CCMP1102]
MEYTTLQNEIWDEMFRRLVAYKKKNKSTNVPIMYETDPKLGYWVSTQRTNSMNNYISEERIRRLNSIGFVWKICVPWMEMYQKLVAYKKKHKSTIVRKEYQADPKLGHWVQTQRKKYNRKALSTDRTNHLESIGFVWDSHDAQWMGMYRKLVEYKKQNKSTAVPKVYTEDPSLGFWVYTQRQVYGKGKLSGKRLELLNSIHFNWSADVWDSYDAQWMEMYSKLVEYKKQNKSTAVPNRCTEDPSLGLWVSTQRSAYNKGKLSGKRLELLNSINFVWSAKKSS